MTTQKRIDFEWNLRKLMASHNLWKSTDLIPLLRSAGSCFPSRKHIG